MSNLPRLPDLSSFDLRLLKVFMSVVEANGFTAAELALNKSKSAISTDISALETRLGVRLCQRGRSGFCLTNHGTEILALTRALFERLDSFRDQVGRVIAYTGGDFSVVIDDSILPDHGENLAQAFGVFKKRANEIFLNVSSLPTEAMTKMILNGSVDVAVGLMPKPVSEISATPLFEEELDLYCASGHALYYRPERELVAHVLGQHDFVDMTCSGDASVGELAHMRVGARANTTQSRLLLILTGKYIGWLPRSAAKPFVDKKELRALGKQFRRQSTVFILQRRSREERASAKLFVSALRDKCFAAPHEFGVVVPAGSYPQMASAATA